MKRYIDANELIETIEYQCETDGSDEALKWCNWFKEVINAEYNRQQKVKPIEASPQLSEESDGNNWIKCSDHLPALDVDVLGTTKDDGNVVKVARWQTCLEDCGWEWSVEKEEN